MGCRMGLSDGSPLADEGPRPHHCGQSSRQGTGTVSRYSARYSSLLVPYRTLKPCLFPVSHLPPMLRAACLAWAPRTVCSCSSSSSLVLRVRYRQAGRYCRRAEAEEGSSHEGGIEEPGKVTSVRVDIRVKVDRSESSVVPFRQDSRSLSVDNCSWKFAIPSFWADSSPDSGRTSFSGRMPLLLPPFRDWSRGQTTTRPGHRAGGERAHRDGA